MPPSTPSPEPRWLTRDELSAWVRLTAVLELLPAALDAQLRRDAQLTHFDYYVLAMLSEAPGRTLRLTSLAAITNSTLPRLSHVVRRLEERGLVARTPATDDRRATDARLTDEGWRMVLDTAPGHVAAVRHFVVDALTPDQLAELRSITGALLERLDPTGVMTPLYERYDS